MKEQLLYLIILYVLTLATCIYVRKNEWMMLFVLASAFLVALYICKVEPIKVLFLALLFIVVEYICVSYQLWKYNNTKYTVPFWVFFAWALSIVFIIKMYEWKLRV